MFSNDEAANIAEAILLFRRDRDSELPPELFSEPAWVFLLELFIADARGQRLTGRQVSERGNIPPRVASAWLLHLSRAGLVVGDGKGDLDDLLTLSPQGLERMERLMKRSRLSEESRQQDYQRP